MSETPHLDELARRYPDPCGAWSGWNADGSPIPCARPAGHSLSGCGHHAMVCDSFKVGQRVEWGDEEGTVTAVEVSVTWDDGIEARYHAWELSDGENERDRSPQ